MRPESLKKEFSITHKPINFIEICPPQRAEVMVEIGTKLNVEVTVIAREGEQYTTFTQDDQGILTPGTEAQVPAGKVCVKVFSVLRDLSEFWKEVHATDSIQTTQ